MIKKTKLVLGIATATFTMAAVMVSPQAAALSKAERVAEAANNKVDALEAQLQAMQAELANLRAEASRPRMDADSEKVQELDQWMASVKAAPPKEDVNDNMIFFRGGFARNDNKRNDLFTGGQFGGDTPNVITNVLGGGPTNRDGWYVGAGFDFDLTDDVWGMMDDTEVDAELMFEYKNFGAKNFNNNPAIVAADGNTTDPAVNPTPQNGPLCTLIQYASSDELQAATGGVPANGAGTQNCNQVSVTQFTLTAAPKIKFLKGSKFRPWIAPAGLAIHVISPPSNGATYITPGVMFAGGAEYAIWKDIKLGVDGRYHLTGTDTDGVKIDGFTAGGYLGIGF
ncbi:MAG: porin family protein [Methylobacter sp.]